MNTEERRQTPTERSHELLKLALERPEPASLSPAFKVEQVKAVGGTTVFEWDVHVPVCDEFPTAEDAFNAAVEYGDRLRRLYPPPNGDAVLEQPIPREQQATFPPVSLGGWK